MLQRHLRWVGFLLFFMTVLMPARLLGQGGLISNGQLVSGHLSSSTQKDVWSFTIPAPPLGGPNNPHIRVCAAVDYTPSANFQPFVYTSGQVGWTPEADGCAEFVQAGTLTYTVQNRNSNVGNISGDYNLKILMNASPYIVSGSGGPMMNGTYNGSALGSLFDIWSFNANAGDNINVTTAGLSSTAEVCMQSQYGLASSCAHQSPTGPDVIHAYAGAYYIFVNAGGQPKTSTAYQLQLSGSTAMPPVGAAENGAFCLQCSVGGIAAGDPVNLATGALFEQTSDYRSPFTNGLAFVRYHNSLENTFGLHSTLMGVNWRSSFDRYLNIGLQTATLERPDGRVISFSLSGSNWQAQSDADYSLQSLGGNVWTVTCPDDSVETYTIGGSGYNGLTQVKARSGYLQTLQITGTQISGVSDSYGRSLSFTLDAAGHITVVKTPETSDGSPTQIDFGYTGSGSSELLTTVGYGTMALPKRATQIYLYESVGLPFALTGVTDEDGNRYATWSYDSAGHVTSSEHDNGADRHLFSYDNATGNRTVTGPLGQQETYKFVTLQNVAKLSEVDRIESSTVSAATSKRSYDANGFVNSRTDWNGSTTNLTNNNHGLPTQIIEGIGTPVQRTINITYDSRWSRLPQTIATNGLTTTLNYDNNGNLLTRTLTDTTTGSTPYATSGQNRTTTYSWTNYGLPTSLRDPRTDVDTTAKLAYDSHGALTKVTNALGYSVQITQHTPGGLPETIVDANGVTTQLEYDARQRLVSRTVTTSAGALKTSYTLDAAGNLTGTTLPDGSSLTNAYDAARRLTQVTDALGNSIKYTLDALGDRTETDVYKSGGALTQKSLASFDALGRDTLDTAGDGQTGARSYDAMGNVLTAEDGLGNTTTNAYDALNRLSTSTDANGGVTKLGYDSHDRLVSIQDANGNTTAYTRDGFGEVIQQVSPDSGTSVFHFDEDSNQTSKTDALGIVTNQTFDALDRILTTVYPASPAENVSRTYDQTGTGFSFGIGRLTSVTDAAGSLSRAYDEQGNLILEQRVHGSTTLSTGYSYDKANHIAGIAYPDGTLVAYGRDAAGQIATVNAKPAGASTSVQLATITHAPFGPMNTTTYGNGVAETWNLNLAYRPTNITDMLSGTVLQNLTYAYDLTANVKGITDAVNPANTQSFGYDALNRLQSATSGPSGYGSFGWTYDKVGNRLTQTQGTTITSYGYTSGTNRLATITVTTLHTALRWPHLVPLSVRSVVLVTKAGPPAPTRSVLPSSPAHAGPPSSFRIAGAAGWPLLLLGLAGLAGFRGRLLNERLLGLIILAFLLSGSLLIGCGGSTSPLPSNPTNPTAATPTFSPTAGIYAAAQTVTLSDATSGATIYYTTDGSVPTTSSAKYGAPFTVSTTETIQAIAVASGYTNSVVASALFTINLPTAATPTFSPAAGLFTSAQSVIISDATPSATIYYTIDGTVPTAGSTTYTNPVAVSATQTLSAIAVASGYGNSAVATAAYTIALMAASPTFSPATGTYTSAQTVTLSDAASGAAIYYTTDGSTPTSSSTRYTAPIIVSASETIRAIAAASGYSDSAVVSATFTINLLAAATPTFLPVAGTYTSAQSVTISDTTPGATIYYTTDGTKPTTASFAYAGPIAVGSNETIQAIALAAGYTNSAVAAEAYTIYVSTAACSTVTTNANGNITGAPSADGYSCLTFTYNNANRPASVTGGPLAANFTYDYAGQRFSKTNNGMLPTVYSYGQNGAVLAENNGGTITDYIYADGRPIAVLQPATPTANQVNYVLADRLGTPQRVTNSDGATVWDAVYQPFGLTSVTNTAEITQRLRFPGQLADEETGFYYNHHRDYMPNLGRYLETDPIGLAGGPNTYSYALNRPNTVTDRRGLQDADPLNVADRIDQLNTVMDQQRKVDQSGAQASDNKSYDAIQHQAAAESGDSQATSEAVAAYDNYAKNTAAAERNAIDTAKEVCVEAMAVLSPTAASVIDQASQIKDAMSSLAGSGGSSQQKQPDTSSSTPLNTCTGDFRTACSGQASN